MRNQVTAALLIDSPTMIHWPDAAGRIRRRFVWEFWLDRFAAAGIRRVVAVVAPQSPSGERIDCLSPHSGLDLHCLPLDARDWSDTPQVLVDILRRDCQLNGLLSVQDTLVMASGNDLAQTSVAAALAALREQPPANLWLGKNDGHWLRTPLETDGEVTAPRTGPLRAPVETLSLPPGVDLRADDLALRHQTALPPRRAVFLDRDGTLIENVPYLADPNRVKLLPQVPEGLRQLRDAGFALVLVTNQSGIGRGYLTAEKLHAVNEALCRQLAEERIVLDAIYFCPVVPGTDDRTVVEHPERKPGPGMLLNAGAQFHLELAESWMVGDAISDVGAGLNAGCRGSIWLQPDGIPAVDSLPEGPTFTCGEFQAATATILGPHQDER